MSDQPIKGGESPTGLPRREKPAPREESVQETLARLEEVSKQRSRNRPWVDAWEHDPRAEEDDNAHWLLTMVDLKTLLLTLFVVLVAYASFEPDRYTGAPVPGMEGKAKESSPISESTVTEIPSESPSSASEKGQGAITPSAQGEISQSPLPLPTQPESSSLPSPSPVLTPATGVPPLPAPPEPPSGPSEAELALKRKLEAMGDQVSVTMTKGQINLQIRDNILFPPGAARLSDEGAALLQGIARTLDEDDYRISIEGHTDSTPIQNVRFASNWELSSGRATAVLRYLIAQGITPARLRAVGYADTRPVADNATAEGRAANRRVNLVLHLQTGENS